MTTPARQTEADDVELVYYWALNRLSNSMALEAKQLWQDSVPPVPDGARRASRSWVTQLVALMFGYRTIAHRLAISYYRLSRALRTDATVRIGEEVDGGTISLERLRAEFEAVLDEVEAKANGDEQFISGDPEGDFVVEEPVVEFVIDDDDILIEDIADLDALIDESDEVAESELRELAENLGIRNFANKYAKADAKARSTDERKVTDKAKAHEDAGNRQASAAMRIMMNASRGLVYRMSEVDSRILGWARYSQTGTPCGFCAMLISREVLYRNFASAGSSRDKDGNERPDADRYHDNCKCVAIPIFNEDQFRGSELFEQNRYYSALWKSRIARKFSGDEALTEWRKVIREDNAQKTNQTQAQAAA